MLDSRPGVRVQRLSVHRDEWDEIPRRLTAGGRVGRVDWFTTIARHTISVSTAGRERIELLVVPPDTAEGTAQAAMTMAATGQGAGQAADILTASELAAGGQHDLGPVTARRGPHDSSPAGA